MIARPAEYLGILLRDQNALLLAAGFAPAFKERSLAELEAAKAAVDSVLQAHKPYPAFAVDRHWNVVLSNSALPQLYEGCSADLTPSDDGLIANRLEYFLGNGALEMLAHRSALAPRS